MSTWDPKKCSQLQMYHPMLFWAWSLWCINCNGAFKAADSAMQRLGGDAGELARPEYPHRHGPPPSRLICFTAAAGLPANCKIPTQRQSISHIYRAPALPSTEQKTTSPVTRTNFQSISFCRCPSFFVSSTQPLFVPRHTLCARSTHATRGRQS